MSTLTLLLAMMLFIFKLTENIESQGDIGGMKAKSESANVQCMSRDIFHVRQDEVQSPRFNTTTHLPAELSMKRNYTPWIAYRGCYQISTLSTKQQKDDLMVHNNTVGNCYWECKMKAMRSNPCGNNADVLFGLHMSHCFCFCNAPVRSDLEQSDRCNVTCSPFSFEDGECGGQDYFSAYIEYKHQGRPLPGFCLICLTISSVTIICGMECDRIATGVCVSDDFLNSAVHFNGTMNSYWDNCKMKNRYITGNTDIVCQNTYTWTGIRKYRIDADYQITTTSATVGSSYSPNNKILVAMVGLLFTILTALSFGCLVWYFRKSRSHNCRRGQKPQNCITTVSNITYDDVITRPESDRKQNSVTCSNKTKIYENQKRLSSKTKDIYVQKDDGQYDCLHSNRQKQVSLLKEDRYGDTSCLGDSYSTAGQTRKSSLIFDDQYNSIVLPGYNGNSCISAENPNYDHIYQPERETDCYIYKCTNLNIP